MALGYRFNRDPNGIDVGLQFPHWWLVAIAVTFAALPWLSLRFSLRTLLIATTLVAVGLGIIISTS